MFLNFFKKFKISQYWPKLIRGGRFTFWGKEEYWSLSTKIVEHFSSEALSGILAPKIDHFQWFFLILEHILVICQMWAYEKCILEMIMK